MNPVLEAIQNRSSCTQLTEPAPDKDTLEAVFKAALNVPDHMQLKPWRFLCIEGDDRKALGQLFAKAKSLEDKTATQETLDKTSAKALRAPLIIVAICKGLEHEKVPELEQQISTGCIVHNLTLILRSLGFGSVWRTGNFAFDPNIQSGLGLTANESIVGYLYTGSPAGRNEKNRAIQVDEFLGFWP